MIGCWSDEVIGSSLPPSQPRGRNDPTPAASFNHDLLAQGSGKGVLIRQLSAGLEAINVDTENGHPRPLFRLDGGPADGLGVAAVLGHGRREFGQAAERGEAGAGGEEFRAPARDGVEPCGDAVHRGRFEQLGEPVERQPVAVAEVERGEGGVEEVADELGRDGLVVCVHDDEGTDGRACRKGDWG